MEKRILTFDEIPSVSNVTIKRQFLAPRAYKPPSNFDTTRSWDEIEKMITEYMKENGFDCVLPKAIAVFSVEKQISPKEILEESVFTYDSNLTFEIYVYKYPSDDTTDGPQYNIVFRRIRGNPFALLQIFLEIRHILQ
jgi:hypothetical protein